jgi:hypothetical protein
LALTSSRMGEGMTAWGRGDCWRVASGQGSKGRETKKGP